jgi:hypothetical protein
MKRLEPALLLGLALGIATVCHTAVARAEVSTSAGTPAVPPGAAASAKPSVAGVSLLAVAGYGASTSEVRGMKLSPYGATFGLDAGFTFRFGLRLGSYVAYSLGKAEQNHRDQRLGRGFDFTADTSSLNLGLVVGYDVPVYLLVLRYDLSFGVTSMHWDFGGVDASDVRYGDAKAPNVGFHFAPGLALLWPHERLLAGVGFDYLVQTSGTIPSGFLGKVLIGVKL